MDIMVLFCKGLHVLALSSITIIFLVRLHGKSPDNVKDIDAQLHTHITQSSSITSFKNEITYD